MRKEIRDINQHGFSPKSTTQKKWIPLACVLEYVLANAGTNVIGTNGNSRY